MNVNISFDIAGLMLLCLLLFSIIVRKMTQGAENRLFVIIMATEIVAACADIASVRMSYTSGDRFLLYLVNITYLVTHSAQGPLHVMFVISVADVWHKILKKKWLVALSAAPYAAAFLLLLTNPLTHWMFTIDGKYEHEFLFTFLYIETAFYVVLDIVSLIKFRRSLNFRKIITLLSMSVFSAIAVVLHILVPSLLTEVFAISLSMLVTNVGILRPEDFIDTTTGLLKHTCYANDMTRAFADGKHVNIIMLNIGNYTSIESMVGYEIATQLVSRIAEQIAEVDKHVRAHSMMYYLDKGRFRMVFPEDGHDRAELTAIVLLQELKKRSRLSGFDINLTPYIVLARCPEEIESFRSLMSFGMDFHEKMPYTGRIVEASEAYNMKEFELKNSMDRIIDRALENNSFQVYYQPIYSIEKKKFVSAEALLRLYDENHGFIDPEMLVVCAEKSGAIHKIGEFVFEEVCKFVSGNDFKRLGLDYIEVNLSVAQCMRSDLADMILDTMRRYNVSADNINLEITETAASYSQRVMAENLNKLSRAGLTFSLDDYGTGYSNMKRVIQLPLKIVKLDKTFADEQHNPKMRIFLQNTVKMLKDMQMEIVVEGIETQEMVDAFSDLKCDFIQGYFFSKPICKNDFINFIASALEG